jgi:tripartite ATP-independent transporter DctM subunit
VRPSDGPAIPYEERAAVSLAKRTTMLLSATAPTAILILAVLGVIFLGIAAPTEAAASGAVVATVLALSYRRLTFKIFTATALDTFRLTGMILLIGSCAYAFVGIFLSAGCGNVVEELILSMPGGKWGAFGIIMFIIFMLGFFIDWIGILFIIIPIISPLVEPLGFHPLWFAMMVCVNLQTSFMTPPFAPGIFFLRGTASPDLGLSMADIIRGVLPFIALVVIGVILIIVFPEIILWLPDKMIK